MGGGFAWTVPMVQAGFSLLFLVARRAGAPREASLWSMGYLLAAAAFTLPLVDPAVPVALIAGGADTLFACAFFCFGEALRTRYGGPDRPAARRALLAAAIAAPLFGTLVIGTVQAELLGSDLGCVMLLAVPLLRIPRRPRAWRDRALIALSWAIAALNLLRTASVPLTAEGATFGSFLQSTYSYLMYADALVSGFSFAALALVVVVSDIIAGYRHDAHVDPLTGLLNRRGFDHAAPPGRTGRTDGVVSCDLDHFKRVNDSFGHDVGDRVLAAFADLVRAVLPAGAVAARTGGEEFVLVLPGHSAAAAGAIADRLRAAATRFDWSAAGIPWMQQASFGVAARCGTDTLADAVRTADARLYEAKRNGRDQICGLRAVG